MISIYSKSRLLLFNSSFLSRNNKALMSRFKSFLEPKIHDQAQRFKQHDLIQTWIRSNRKRPHQTLVCMTPAMIEFVMGFEDFNQYYLRYPDTQTQTSFEKVINAHTYEDATHSRLFLKEWDTLEVDSLLDWKYSDYMHSVMTTFDATMKRQGLKLYRLAYYHPYPFERFALMETIETAGKVFFSATVDLAEDLSLYSGKTYPYFGPYHLALENGHLQNEAVFFQAEADKALILQKKELLKRYEKNGNDFACQEVMSSLIKEVGHIFFDTFTVWHDTAMKFSKNASFYTDLFQKETRSHFFNKISQKRKYIGEYGLTFYSKPVLNFLQNDILQDGFSSIENHTVYRKLSAAKEITPKIFSSFALIDILGTAFVCRFNEWTVTDCPEGNFLKELAIAISEVGNALIHDWKVLDLDEMELNSKTSQVLSFKFFEQQSNQHRQHFSEWFKGLLRHPDPLIQSFVLYATIVVYQIFLKSFASLLNSALCSSSLILLNDRWFQDFHHRFQRKMIVLETQLSVQQKEIILQQVLNLLKRFTCQLDKIANTLEQKDSFGAFPLSKVK